MLTNVWRIQDAVFERLEADEPLPSDLDAMAKDLDAAAVKTRLVGSEEVVKMTLDLAARAERAIIFARSDNTAGALDASRVTGPLVWKSPPP